MHMRGNRLNGSGLGYVAEVVRILGIKSFHIFSFMSVDVEALSVHCMSSPPKLVRLTDTSLFSQNRSERYLICEKSFTFRPETWLITLAHTSGILRRAILPTQIMKKLSSITTFLSEKVKRPRSKLIDLSNCWSQLTKTSCREILRIAQD